MKKASLFVIPSVPVWLDGDALAFDRKFYDGMLLYTQLWPGKVTCIMSITDTGLLEFGVVNKNVNEIPFECITLGKDKKVTAEQLKEASIVLASGDSHDQLHISTLCKNNGIKCVYVIEYIPETRYQIARLSTNNSVVRLRRYFYLWQFEQKRKAAFKIADGLQSNGTPAFYEYRKLSNTILYFDTRVGKDQGIRDDELEKRLAYLTEGNPLRLAFSGRLIRMKGADHLIQLAHALKKSNIRFIMTIYGIGELENEMRELIQTYKLEDLVTMKGAVDFYKELLPDIKKNVDLFVCFHRQSDPSCTYLETLSCGIPIVGYRNKAFEGLNEISEIGWGAELEDIQEVTRIIGYLDKNRTDIASRSRKSVLFARPHDFETTFQNRVTHLLSLLN